MSNSILNFEIDNIDFEKNEMIIKQFGSLYFVYDNTKSSPIYRFIKTYLPQDLLNEYQEQFRQILMKLSNGNRIILDIELNNIISNSYINKKIEGDYFDVFVSLEELSSKVFVKKYKNLKIHVDDWRNLIFLKNDNTQNLSIRCFGMKNLDWLINFPKLEKIDLEILESEEQNELNNIDGIQFTQNLKVISFAGDKNKEFLDLNPIASLKKVENLTLYNCSKIKDLNVLKSITTLDPNNVSVGHCEDLNDISFLLNEMVEEDEMYYVNDLPNVKNLGNLSNFKELKFNGGFHNDLIHELRKYPNIEKITIENKDVIFHLNGGVIDTNFYVDCCTIKLSGDSVKNLELYSNDCKDLKGISDLPNLENLIISSIPECCYFDDLTSLDGIEALTSLKSLVIDSVPNLVSITGVENCINLESLIIIKCNSLVDISPLAKLKNLKFLNLSYCRSLALKPKPYCMEREQLLKYQIDLLNFYGQKVSNEFIDIYEEAKLSKQKKYSPALVQKIKQLLNSNDINLVDSGITLIKGLNEPKLYDTLLSKVKCVDGDVDLKDFLKGKIENIPFKNYIFLEISKIVSTTDRWKSLCESIKVWRKPIVKQGSFDHFTNLEYLKLTGFSKSEFPINNKSVNTIIIKNREDLTFDIGHLAGCTNCEELSIHVNTLVNGLTELRGKEKIRRLVVEFNHFKNNDQISDSFFEPISNCIEMNYLSICLNDNYTISNPVSDATFLSKLIKIETLILNGVSFNNGDFLVNYNSLRTLNISNNPILTTLTLPKIKDSITLYNLIQLQNVTAIEKSDIQTFDLRKCKSLISLNFLSLITTERQIYFNSSQKLDFIGCFSLTDITGINHLHNSSILLETEELPFIGVSNHITHIKSNTLKTLKRVELYVNLLDIDLSSNENLIDIHDINSLKSINSLDLSNCKNLKTLKGLMNCKINHLNLCDTKSLEDIKDLEFMDFQKIYIAGSSIKKSDIPARLIPVLDWRSRPNGLI